MVGIGSFPAEMRVSGTLTVVPFASKRVTSTVKGTLMIFRIAPSTRRRPFEKRSSSFSIIGSLFIISRVIAATFSPSTRTSIESHSMKCFTSVYYAPSAEADRSPFHPHHRFGTHRHRPGGRVRLLRNAGVQGPQRRGLPDHPRQLQSGHDHDRSGVRGPHLHRAAHAGSAGADHRARETGRDPADGGRTDRHQPRDCTL